MTVFVDRESKKRPQKQTLMPAERGRQKGNIFLNSQQGQRGMRGGGGGVGAFAEVSGVKQDTKKKSLRSVIEK